MIRMRHPILFAFFLLPNVFVLAQGHEPDRSADATASVPALDHFHTVIMEIWHEAWPKKDTAVLRRVQPEVDKGISGVAAAKLPGILREKQKAWDENVKKLQAAGAEYKAAAAGNDDPRLLSAAEKLHSQFEALMRVTRPAVKELDAFHSSLYMLYHHYLPGFEKDKIKSSVAELKVKMAALNQAKLPERLKAKEESFTSARAKLSSAVDELAATVAGTEDRKKIEDAVNAVHSEYETLNELFE
jgi:hypothetical protein